MNNQNSQLNRRRFIGSAIAAGAVTALAINQQESAHASPVAMPAPVMVDDFTLGKHEFYSHQTGKPIANTDEHYATPPPSTPAPETHLLAGHRFTRLHIAQNPRMQPSHLNTGSGYLHMGGGNAAYYRLELGYGYTMVDGAVRSQAMHADFSLHSALKLTFAPICASVNFNIVLFSAGGNASYGVNWHEHARQVGKTIAFSDFTPQTGTVTLADVYHLYFVFQAEGQFGLESIQLV